MAMYEDDGANVSSTSLLLTTGGAGAAGLNNNPGNYLESSNGSNWSNWTGESEDYLKNSPAVQVHIYILYAVIFTVGLVGNVLVVFVVAQNKAMQTVTNCYIANLALSDILLCVLAVPFTPLYFFLKEWIFGKILCHLVAYSQVSAIKVLYFPPNTICIFFSTIIVRWERFPGTTFRDQKKLLRYNSAKSCYYSGKADFIAIVTHREKTFVTRTLNK